MYIDALFGGKGACKQNKKGGTESGDKFQTIFEGTEGGMCLNQPTNGDSSSSSTIGA